VRPGTGAPETVCPKEVVRRDIVSGRWALPGSSSSALTSRGYQRMAQSSDDPNGLCQLQKARRYNSQNRESQSGEFALAMRIGFGEYRL
jgi:hypothetical protein